MTPGLLAALLALALPASEPVFSVSVEAVYVDVFVSDTQGPVRGLAARDFEVRDDGVPQTVEVVATENLPFTTLLVFDTSDSVRGQKLAELRAAGHALLQQYRAGDEVGLVSFGHQIRLELAPNADPKQAADALRRLQPAGSTALVDALFGATVLAGRGRTLLILFTDGEDNMSILRMPDLVRTLERSDVTVQAVGVVPGTGGAGSTPSGARLLEREPERVRVLRRLAETTGGRFWTASAPDELGRAFLGVLDAMRTRYVLRFEPTGVEREGRHTLSVRLRNRPGTVHHRKAYYATPARDRTSEGE